MSKIEVDTIAPQSGTTVTLGESGDTIQVASGATNNLGITEADQWRLTASITANANPISANLERIDTAGQGTLGTGMSVSSGYWTFPSTGIWKVEFGAYLTTASGDSIGIGINVTTNNSTYTEISRSVDGNDSVHAGSLYCNSLIDVTDTTNVKISFKTFSMAAGSIVEGSTDSNYTYFTFIRLGDT